MIAFLIVVLALGALAVFARSNNTASLILPTPTPTGSVAGEQIAPTDTPVTAETPTMAAGTTTLSPGTTGVVPKTLTVTINPVNTTISDQNGTAVLTEKNGRVQVVLDLSSTTPITNPQPAHIHSGSCDTLGNIVYPLSNVVNGKSITTINVTMAKLLSSLPLAINVHQSAADINTYTSCGNITPP